MTSENLNIKKELTRYLLKKVKQKDLNAETAISYIKELQSTSTSEPELMAVIGLACRFPDADNPDEFWENLASGRNSIKAFPTTRKEDFKRIGGNVDLLEKSGFLETVDNFDPEYFNIPPKVALQMDPYHRLMLQVFVETIEDAGYYSGQLQGREIGIFVGNDHTHRLVNSYLSFLAEEDFAVMTGSWTGILASRLSYLLNLRGPALVIDTACSSSLVALDQAIKSIRQGDCEEALVGGANLIFTPEAFTSEIQSGDYKVRAFDVGAKGTVWGEGVAGVYIKSLSKALADRDNVYGIIRGIAVNNDGKSNGLTAPSAKAQQDVLLKAWERAGVPPETISYIETHGTGTNLGDPIEVKGLTTAFRKHTNKHQFCAIGSIKTNIGHTVGVSGLASFIKVLLSMREQALPPSLNFQQPNPLIDFSDSPVYVQDRLTEWKRGDSPHRAGISSFSFSGTNCHLVVEEAPYDERGARNEEWMIFPITARNSKLFLETALNYKQHIERHSELRLEDICFTVSTGREQHPLKAVILCRDKKGLSLGLSTLISTLSSTRTKKDITKVETKEKDFYLWLGPVPSTVSQSKVDKVYESNQVKEQLNILVKEKENVEAWKKLCLLFVQGAVIDFNRLFIKEQVKRCSLPAQVFKKERYWDETPRQLASKAQELVVVEQSLEMTSASIWAEAKGKGSRLNKKNGSPKPIEAFAAWAWSEVLGYSIINEEDDFYALGGDSVTGLRIIQAISLAFEKDIPLSALMGTSVFADFVNGLIVEHGILEDGAKVDDTSLEEGKKRIVQVQEGRSLPLSPAQYRVFLSYGIKPDSLAYNVTGVRRLGTTESFEKVNELIHKLIEHHESLRASFHMERDVAVQLIHRDVKITVERHVLQEEENKTRIEVIQEKLKEFIRPFDLSEAPLFRVGYFEFNGQETFLAIDMHHIITDGTSMGLLFSDYMTLTKEGRLTPSRLSYPEAITWLLNRLEDPQLQKQREWWMGQFADGVPVLELPTDKPRPIIRDHKGSRVFHTLPKTLVDEIKVLAKNNGATLFMILIGAFHNLLARMSGERDIVIGTPVAGRSNRDLNKIVGMFVNTLPLRTKSKADERFTDFLEKMKSTVLKAFDYQDYPYESLIEDLNLERIPGRNPLFDVYFVLQNIEMGLPREQDEVIDFDSRSAKFDLTVSARETTEGLLMEWEYADSIYNQSSIGRMARRYEWLLTSLVENPQKTLGELEIMDQDEYCLLLEEWNNTGTSFPGNEGIIPLFEQWVSSQGESDALVMDDKRMSYQELNRRSNQIARTIIQKGGLPGTAITLLMDRSFDMIATILGVLKAGCHYVPLDTGDPAERLISVINDCSSRILVTHHSLERTVLNGQTEELKVIDVDMLDSQLSDHNLNIEVSGDDLAYIVYTSGSTGTPKGTLIRQEGVIRVVRDAEYLTIYPEDVLLQLSNYSFDGATFDIFGALLNGASLVLLHKHEVTEPKALGKIVQQNQVSVFFITTSLFNALVDVNSDCLDSTRTVLFGGEAASIHHVRRAFEQLGPGRIYNVYGPTETTVFATYYPINTLSENVGIPIGKAIANTTLYVLDDQLRLQPVGVPGELYIGGVGLAKGYLNRPDLTNKSFVENPFQLGEKLYRTGDMVAWREDGYLRYLGRRDQQVKLRGYRIELTEIETHALLFPSIKAAYAGVYTDETGGNSLSLWVVPDGKITNLDIQALKRSLEQSLPDYMVPTFIQSLVALPLNKNGKVDKNLLPKPIPLIGSENKRPQNKQENILVDIWSQVLGIVQPGISDNFFALGGDSIKAIQVIARIQDAGYGLEMQDIFQYQTIESLAPHLKIKRRVEAEQGEIQGSTLPSVIQQWFLDFGPNRPNHFNQAMWVKTREKIKFLNLELALQRLCQHHDALRMVVSSSGNIRLKSQKEDKLFHVTEIPSDVEGETLKDYLIHVQRLIDLEEGPIIAVAFRERMKGGELFIAIHHIAIDVVSWRPILEDLFELLAHPNKVLPQKTTPFPVWTSNLAKWARNGGAKNELPYWREMAKKTVEIAPTFPSNKVSFKDTVCVKHWIDGKTGSSLCNEANHSFNTDTVELLLSVLTQAIGAWREKSNMLFNLEGHGREEFQQDLDISRTIGWFTSTFPVLFEVGKDVGDTIKNVKESIRSVPRRGFGFGVLRSLTPNLSLVDKELLDCMKPSISFNYLGVQDDDFGEIQVKALPSDITIDGNFETNWALDIVAFQVGSRLCLEIRYPKSFFSNEEFGKFKKLLNEKADEIAKYCSEQGVGEKTASDYTVSSLSQQELENILEDLNI